MGFTWTPRTCSIAPDSARRRACARADDGHAHGGDGRLAIHPYLCANLAKAYTYGGGITKGIKRLAALVVCELMNKESWQTEDEAAVMGKLIIEPLATPAGTAVRRGGLNQTQNC